MDLATEHRCTLCHEAVVTAESVPWANSHIDASGYLCRRCVLDAASVLDLTLIEKQQRDSESVVRLLSQPDDAPGIAETLDWLLQVSAYVRFEVGPPGAVRVVVHDPLDGSNRAEAHRVTTRGTTAEAALRQAGQWVREIVERGQAKGQFSFLPPGERGWDGDTPLF